MTGSSPAAPLELKLEDWPEGDRARWRAGTMPGRSLDGDKYAATLRPDTVRLAGKAYGRYLAFLRERAELNPAAPPGERVSMERLRDFVSALREAGNVDNSIATRIWGLRVAVEIMEAGRKFGWITSPGGVAIRAILPQVHRAIPVRHAEELFQWGLKVMAAAHAEATPLGRAVRYRNGLIIALLARRGMRLQTLSLIRIGVQFRAVDGEFWLHFRAEDMKTRKPLSYPVPDELRTHMDRYLASERPALLAGNRHDWLWVNQAGGKFGKHGIAGMIRRASSAEFGVAHGPHRFRHSIGTTAPIADPTRPALAAAMLGASQAVVEAHYNLGDQQLAAARFHEVLRRERENTAGLASRLLEGKGPSASPGLATVETLSEACPVGESSRKSES